MFTRAEMKSLKLFDEYCTVQKWLMFKHRRVRIWNCHIPGRFIAWLFRFLYSAWL